MAFGEHWEWRGFGPPGEPLYDEIRGLPVRFSRAQEVTDRYLWLPGCPLNVKLRGGDFKIKRLLETDGSGLERWLEDAGENYSFPLAFEVLAEVAAALGVSLEAQSTDAILGSDELLDLLRQASPSPLLIRVEKRRWQHSIPDFPGVIVELAEIVAPEPVVSVGLEGRRRDGVQEALRRLHLPGSLRPMSYLGALEIWGRGERIIPGPPAS